MSLKVPAFRSPLPSPSRPCLSDTGFSLTGACTRFKLWFACSSLDLVKLTWSASQQASSITSQSLQPSIRNLSSPWCVFWAWGGDATRGEVKYLGMCGLLTGRDGASGGAGAWTPCLCVCVCHYIFQNCIKCSCISNYQNWSWPVRWKFNWVWNR